VRQWLCCLLPVFAGPAAGFDVGPGIQLHGFLTQGFFKTTDNRVYGDSPGGSFDFTEIGINASYKASPSVLIAGQILSRRAGDLDDGSPTLDYALLDWNLAETTEFAYGVIAGRIKNTLGFYNDTRDVAFTRPSIVLPQQVYFDNVRNLIHSADGINIYGRFYNDWGNVSLNAGAGVPNVDENVEISFMGTDFGGSLEAEDLAFIARAEYGSPDGTWRMALSGAKAKLQFERGSADPVGNGQIDFLYWIASLQYNAERWSLTAEYMEEPAEFDNFGPLLDSQDSPVQGYYLQGSYLIRNDLEWIVRYGEGFFDKHDRDGSKSSAATGGFVPAHNFFRKDWLVGLRWDVTPSFMVRAEYQWLNGTWALSRRENPDPTATVEDWEMFSLLGSYRF
jgi:hypothetical protein